MSAQVTIDRTPGRLVVWALICLYGWFFLFFLGAAFSEAFLALSTLPALACPLLILAAIFTHLGTAK